MKTGLIAIIGRPNVGKSTLINALVGVKISITADKPQTTRHRILGVRTEADAQFVFVDTPGYQTRHKGALNSAMNRAVTQALAEVDVILWVFEAGRFTPADEQVLRLLPRQLPHARPVIAILNKVDLLADKTRLLPALQSLSGQYNFAEMVPLSARAANDVSRLLAIIQPYLPEGEAMFEADEITDRSERFLAAEIVREKVFRLTGEEIPYGTAVEIEQFIQEPSGMRRIGVVILVDREMHKPILLGAGGERMKRIATEARQDMERLFDAKVHLTCWIKIKSGWMDSTAMLRRLGLE
ncbi:MAG: GTPase Era [Betaproteobacteria bacterium]|nr:MAG: GTPase Era [Betaproteobacteria bacterium]